VDFTLDSGLRLEVVNQTAVAPANTRNAMNPGQQASIASVPRVNLVHANLPTIHFLPDGSLGERSPQMLHLTGDDGGSLWLVQSRDGSNNYEIRNTDR
jgi:hypothetical protein